ncbi:Dihydrolipoamide acyltransferase component of branched-chain alpha-keto acid dehydrogenase complex [Streptomyces lividans 1326]|uniref:Dihydrolipoamide acyltransferase component of branched-chain alpha-keto acid dehydrogenase complex n=1 Tax=Streptomyces lividans 1326 TaxID=1200984 RepID=A0A7U9DQI2_STRLI|nr:Dihydrolipoamide acyltransferase component of branched-chain alpha-keto acid dehydrogenase complex [Streptomyces lividans 1326]
MARPSRCRASARSSATTWSRRCTSRPSCRRSSRSTSRV